MNGCDGCHWQCRRAPVLAHPWRPRVSPSVRTTEIGRRRRLPARCDCQTLVRARPGEAARRRTDRARDRGARPRAGTTDERRDRRPAVRLGAHGRDPRVGAAAQARRQRPAGARSLRRRPTRSTVGRRGALPIPLTTFVGRTVERAELVAAFRDHRLVTATGPGGVGKTRLALAAAADVAGDLPDGVVFVDLVKVTQPDAVVDAIATAADVPEASTTTREEALVGALGEAELPPGGRQLRARPGCGADPDRTAAPRHARRCACWRPAGCG